MAVCDACGNDYAKSFEVTMEGETYTFDSFECAIHQLAPSCAKCGVRVIGHGIQAPDAVYCCAHCAEAEGFSAAQDNVGT